MLPRSRYAKSMLTGTMRGFVIKHKGIFLKAIIAFAKILPEPKREDCKRPNSPVLFDIWDRLLKHLSLVSRIPLFKAARKLHIAEYEHDPWESELFDCFVEELVIAYLDGAYQPRTIGRPAAYWNEPIAEQEAKREKIKQLLRRE